MSLEPFHIFVQSVQAPPDGTQHRVLLLCSGEIPSHDCPVSVLRMAVHKHTSRYFPPVTQEQMLVFLLSGYNGKSLTEVLHCAEVMCTYCSVLVQTCLHFLAFSSSASRSGGQPAQMGGCGYCCPLAVCVCYGGDWLHPLPISDGNRTENTVYAGNINNTEI